MSEIIYKLVHKSGAVLELPPHTSVFLDWTKPSENNKVWRIKFADGQRFNLYDNDLEWTCYKQVTTLDIDSQFT